MYKNAVNLIGFIGKDAQIKANQDDSTNFTVLSLATKESWKNKQTNQWESRTEWHRVLAFGKLGEFAATLAKGSHIEIEGTLRSREQTFELKGSSKKNPEMKTVRSWFIRAESIRKLDRAEKSSEATDVPFWRRLERPFMRPLFRLHRIPNRVRSAPGPLFSP